MNDDARSTAEFSFPIDVESLPHSGRSFDIAATQDQCAAVAARLGVQDIAALSVHLDVVFASGGMIKVTGHVDGSVTQACVISLAPVPATISEPIDVTFITEERAAAENARKEKAARRKNKDDDEDFADVDMEPPEVALGGRIDLGELAIMHLALGLDPYPRAPGASFDPNAWGLNEKVAENEAQPSPFAALAKLTTPDPKRGRE